MRINYFYSVSILLLLMPAITGIYNHSVTRIEGGTYPLSNCQGKKILITTLPLQPSAAADSALYSLDTLGQAHTGDLTVIAVPAFEDGYTVSQKEQLKQWYRNKLGNHIIVTEGMYTRKTSASQQHPLFRWLTTVAENEVFDIDVDGEGYKFFVSSSGRLCAVLRPHTRIWSQAVQKTLRL